MPTPSPLLTAAFVALVVAMWALFVVAVFRAERRSGAPVRAATLKAACAAGACAVIGGVSLMLAARGALRDTGTPPPAAFKVILPATLVTIGLALSPLGKRLATTLRLEWLVGFQAFRVAVELILWALHREGAIPEQMTFAGRNFDVLTGLSALVVGIAVAKGRVGMRGVLVWNVVGLGLLVNILAVAILSMPSFHRFDTQPANTLVATAPWVLLPVVLVQAALFGHLLVFRRALAGESSPHVAMKARHARA